MQQLQQITTLNTPAQEDKVGKTTMARFIYIASYSDEKHGVVEFFDSVKCAKQFCEVHRFTGKVRKFIENNSKECVWGKYYLMSKAHAAECVALIASEEEKRKVTHHRVIKAWHYTPDWADVLNGVAVPEEGCDLIPMQGYAKPEDYYLCVPKKCFATRAACCSRYGDWKIEYFADGQFCGAGSKSKFDKAKALYDAGYIEEIESYIKGYMLWRETTLGGGHINERKEAARLSHFYCDMPGRVGHKERQRIRRAILNGTFNY